VETVSGEATVKENWGSLADLISYRQRQQAPVSLLADDYVLRLDTDLEWISGEL